MCERGWVKIIDVCELRRAAVSEVCVGEGGGGGWMVIVDCTYDAVAVIGAIVTGIIHSNSAIGSGIITSGTIRTYYYCVAARTSTGVSHRSAVHPRLIILRRRHNLKE